MAILTLMSDIFVLFSLSLSFNICVGMSCFFPPFSVFIEGTFHLFLRLIFRTGHKREICLDFTLLHFCVSPLNIHEISIMTTHPGGFGL